MENKVYIGINDIGQSTRLQEINQKKINNSILIKDSENNNALDSNVINKSNQAINRFKKFIDKLFSFNVVVPLKALTTKDRNDFHAILQKAKQNDELEKIWKKIIEDPNLNFLKNQKVLTIINSNKEEVDKIKFDISKKLYEFNFADWTTTSKIGNETYGTRKLVYFQIKFIYEYLDLIGNNKQDKYLLVDEPELFLHPSMVRQVGYMLKKIGEKINVIISTHSTTFLNSFYNPQKTEIYFKKSYKERWRQIALKKPLGFSSRKICFEVITASKVIIVEGTNDIKLLEYIINNQDKVNKDIVVLTANGKDKIPSLFNIVRELEYQNHKKRFDEKDIFILYDVDTSKIKSKKSHKKWNDVIEELIDNRYGFPENLEKYFNIKVKKTKWDIDAFFNKKENEEKLYKFLKESKLMNFLSIKNVK